MDHALATVRALLDSSTAETAEVIHTLFRLECPVASDVVRTRIGTEALAALLTLGLARETEEHVVGTTRLTRFRGLVIASDRLGFRHRPDFVLGPGPATASLASVIRPVELGRALDLGTGPGSLALWLAALGSQALGIDISDRALAFASFNRRLNDLPQAGFETGDFLTAPPDPELDEQFDLSVANPPFVLAPSSSLVYRDGPLPGDDTTRVAIERVARSLAAGGRGYVIGCWADDGADRWDARPRHWLRALRGRALITRISSVSSAEYARSWTADLDSSGRAKAETAWQQSLADRGIRRITTGVIALANPRRSRFRRAAIAALETARPGWRTVEAMLEGC